MKPVRKKRKYTEAFKAKALAALDANGGNLGRTARQVGIPVMTLKGWRDDADSVPTEVRAQKKAELADELERLAVNICGIDVARLKSLNLRDAGVTLGIAVDKLLVLRGQPNQISRTEGDGLYDWSKLTPDELRAVADLHAKARGEPVPEEASDLNNPVIFRDNPDEAAG